MNTFQLTLENCILYASIFQICPSFLFRILRSDFNKSNFRLKLLLVLQLFKSHKIRANKCFHVQNFNCFRLHYSPGLYLVILWDGAKYKHTKVYNLFMHHLLHFLYSNNKHISLWILILSYSWISHVYILLNII